MKALLLLILFFNALNVFTQIRKHDNFSIHAASTIFFDDGLQLNAGIGKFINRTNSSLYLDFIYTQGRKKIYTENYAIKFSYFYSYRDNFPLYLNIGGAFVTGIENKKILIGVELLPQAEGKIFNFLSIFFEPRLCYNFTESSPFLIKFCGGLKLYL